MVRSGRMYYDGSFMEWEEYLDKVAARARQQRGTWEVSGGGSQSGSVEADLEDL